MIITQLKPKEEILKLLENYEKIFIVGCNSCAKQCETGGEEDIKKMGTLLEKNGKEISGWIVPDETCHIPLVKKDLRVVQSKIKNSQAVLVMACGAGVRAVKEAISVRVYPALDTLSLANTDRVGNFSGKCSMCGKCILGETGGICPVTICPKGMLNGPCGGMSEGKCEVDIENECVWAAIYNTLLEYNDIKIMKEIKKPKDYSKVKRGNSFKTRK